jgi:hypothetical protein
MYRVMHRLVAVFALAVACTAFFASGAAAAPAPTGTRLSIFSPAQTFPAGQPFYFEHGWQLGPQLGPSVNGGIGLWTFSLSVDGVPQMGFADTQVTNDPTLGTLIFRPYLFNFPNGMTGTHVFLGTFSGPCAAMVAGGFATGPCSSPNEIVTWDAGPFTSIVTFVP